MKTEIKFDVSKLVEDVSRINPHMLMRGVCIPDAIRLPSTRPIGTGGMVVVDLKHGLMARLSYNGSYLEVRLYSRDNGVVDEVQFVVKGKVFFGENAERMSDRGEWKKYSLYVEGVLREVAAYMDAHRVPDGQRIDE